MVGELVRREADIAIAPLTINSQREQVFIVLIILILLNFLIILILPNILNILILLILLIRWLTSQNPSCLLASPS